MAFTAASNSYQFVIAAKNATDQAFDGVNKNIEKLDGGLKGVAMKARALAGPAALGIASFGAAAAASIGAITLAAADSAREIDNLSLVAGIGAESFQKIAYGAKQFGVEQDKVSDILKDTNDKLGDFMQTGAGPLKDFFEQIAPRVGVTADQFRNLNSADAMQLYVSSLEKANVSQAEMTFYMEAIASDATLLLPLLRDNGKAMKEQAEEAEKLGIALSDVDTAMLSELDRTMSKNAEVFKGFTNQLAVEFAPIIMAVSNEFLNAAKEAGGFGNIATRVFDAVVKAAGYTANVIRGLEVVWLGVKIAAAGMVEGVLAYFEKLELGVRGLLQYVPGVEIATESAIGNIRQSFTNVRQDIQKEFMDTLNAPMPYDSVVTWAENVKSQAQEVSRTIALAKAGKLEGESVGGLPEAANDPSEDEEAANDAVIEKAEKRQEWLTDIWNQGEKDRQVFQKKSLGLQSKQTFGVLADITAGVANHNKGLFRLNQLAGIANATINTAEGVTKALAAYPPPLSFAMAAAQLAAGIAQISAIKSASYGGGGGPATVGGATAVGTQPITTAPSNIANQPSVNDSKERNVNVNFYGNVSGLDKDDIAETIAELIDTERLTFRTA